MEKLIDWRQLWSWWGSKSNKSTKWTNQSSWMKWKEVEFVNGAGWFVDCCGVMGRRPLYRGAIDFISLKRNSINSPCSSALLCWFHQLTSASTILLFFFSEWIKRVDGLKREMRWSESRVKIEFVGPKTHNHQSRNLNCLSIQWSEQQTIQLHSTHFIKQKKINFLFFDFVSFHLLNEAELKKSIITVILNEDWTYKDKSEIIDEMKMNQ